MIEIKKVEHGGYQFLLKSKAGSVLLRSISFDNKTEITEVVDRLNQNYTKKLLFERKTDYKGQFQFYLKNNKGKVIGHSQPYNSEAGMENGIKNLTNSISNIKLI
ncbi:YegP family protein [Croceitalea rosinachiae]|uniref:YegP family protein n=1 Tax=Croceitalea rosinachiae TaxID=3075596 RepID=A0ABU3AE66_9FLAO|nr:YegP family protein [Croceitalea sp. F388]MDT0607393.1 YegP family protein [Croceitalea sp. F388]